MSTTAAIILLVANDEKTLLRILPTKRVARPKKNGSGMTKADPNKRANDEIDKHLKGGRRMRVNSVGTTGIRMSGSGHCGWS